MFEKFSQTHGSPNIATSLAQSSFSTNPGYVNTDDNGWTVTTKEQQLHGDQFLAITCQRENENRRQVLQLFTPNLAVWNSAENFVKGRVQSTNLSASGLPVGATTTATFQIVYRPGKYHSPQSTPEIARWLNTKIYELLSQFSDFGGKAVFDFLSSKVVIELKSYYMRIELLNSNCSLNPKKSHCGYIYLDMYNSNKLALLCFQIKALNFHIVEQPNLEIRRRILQKKISSTALERTNISARVITSEFWPRSVTVRLKCQSEQPKSCVTLDVKFKIVAVNSSDQLFVRGIQVTAPYGFGRNYKYVLNKENLHPLETNNIVDDSEVFWPKLVTALKLTAAGYNPKEGPLDSPIFDHIQRQVHGWFRPGNLLTRRLDR